MLDLEVQLAHFHPAADDLDAVINRFELGGFVHDVHGGDDFSAIMQPGGDVQLVFFFLVEGEVFEEAVAVAAGGVGQHFGQHGYADAMGAGIGGFGVDRGGHHFDEGFE